ncbi:hypothetical protein ACFQU2_03965 [Siccirubricoccus deserti]
MALLVGGVTAIFGPAMMATCRSIHPAPRQSCPVLTLLAAVVAERLGHSEETALTLGRAVAGASARVKARRLGIADERSGDGGGAHRAASQGHDRKAALPHTVRLLGREMPVAAAKGGTVVPLNGDEPGSPTAIRNYLARPSASV